MSEITRRFESGGRTLVRCIDEGWEAVVDEWVRGGPKAQVYLLDPDGRRVKLAPDHRGHVWDATLEGKVRGYYDLDGIRATVERLRAGETTSKQIMDGIAAWNAAHPRIPMDQGGLEALIEADRPK